MRARLLVLSMMLGGLLAFSAVTPAHAEEQPDGTLTVSGMVTDPATGQPVTNAAVAVVTSSYLQSRAKKNGEGVIWCEELFPNQSVTGTTDESGQYSVELKAYNGSDDCEFLVVGNAELPSGDLAKGGISVSGLIPNAGVQLSLPGASAQANVPVQTPTAEQSSAATSAAEPESGFPRWLDEAGPWLLRIGVVLGVAAIIGFFLWLTVLVARAARRKGRSYWAWFWIAFFFLIPAAIIVAIMAPRPEYQLVSTAQPTPSGTAEPVKRCPYCGEEILAVAKKCKHCGEFLDSD